MFGIPSWAVLLVVSAISAGSATYVTREVYTGKIAKIELAQKEAEVAAFKKAQAMQRDADQVAIDIAGNQSNTQEKIVTVTKTIIKEIPTYVKDDSACITVGLVRVLDAAARGTDPAALALAPGEFNETCAGLGSHALADSVAENYGRARQDAAQLTDLQTYVRGVQAALDRQR